jgi:hypothetical protein
VPETVAHLSAFDRATVQIQHAAADGKATVHDQRGPTRLEFFDGQYLCPTWVAGQGRRARDVECLGIFRMKQLEDYCVGLPGQSGPDPTPLNIGLCDAATARCNTRCGPAPLQGAHDVDLNVTDSLSLPIQNDAPDGIGPFKLDNKTIDKFRPG